MSAPKTEFVAPTYEPPFRILVRGRATSGWYALSNEEQGNRVLPRFKQLTDEWRSLGLRPIATFDDDLTAVGELNSGFGWYLICEVDSLDVPVAMMQRVRTAVDGVRMDQYVSFDIRLGRSFFLLEPSSP